MVAHDTMRPAPAEELGHLRLTVRRCPGRRLTAAASRIIGAVSPAAAQSPWPRLIGVFVFAVAFGLVEAMVVIYLRKLFGLQYALQSTPRHVHFPHAYLGDEQAREAATMVMLLAVGFLAGRTWWQRFAYWIFAFGVWDIFYYVWLYAYVRWPTGTGSRDLLFLIPGEWWAPVWQPVLASGLLIAVAVLVLAVTRRA
jgi:hypothetical protein